ncbi:MAG: hypothetical protein Kapaf2KO_20040 [Candidatus Kapaibacteriales bacterium]
MRKKINKKEYKASNYEAIKLLIIPVLLVIFFIIMILNDTYYILSQVILGVLFTQFFILMHEAGHNSFFKSRTANRLLGYVSGFLALVPFYSWKKIHDLHHKWTGWRDKDPNTIETIQPDMKGLKMYFVNFCWFFLIPIFSLLYRINNYWIPGKLKKYMKGFSYSKSVVNIVVQLALYLALIFFFSSFLLTYILPGLILGLMITELIIVSQHSHIDIPISEGKDVKRVQFEDQVQYSRSIDLNPLIAKFLLFNFNMHEKHHSYPWVPAYYISNIDIDTVNNKKFLNWFLCSKTMTGSTYLFKTTKHTGKNP